MTDLYGTRSAVFRLASATDRTSAGSTPDRYDYFKVVGATIMNGTWSTTAHFMRMLGLIAPPFFLLFYLMLSGLGYKEHLLMRLLAAITAAPAAFITSPVPSRSTKLYWEGMLLFNLPFHFLFFTVLNDFSTYWAMSLMFSGFMYGFCSGHYLVTVAGFPFGMAIGIAYCLKTGMSDGAMIWANVGDLAVAWFAATLGGILKVIVDTFYGLLKEEQQKSEQLLLNILPYSVAQELKAEGTTRPVYYESVTVMFTDFAGFTSISQHISAARLVEELDAWFTKFDEISREYGLEKIKTMGDSYMCCAGIPMPRRSHAVDTVLAAMRIQSFAHGKAEAQSEAGLPVWRLRLGIHTGPIVAGVVGRAKFAYDVFGDTVNTASRFESCGEPGRINVSKATYEAVREYFDCTYRGKVDAKGKGAVDMYFVNRLLPEFAGDETGQTPNKNLLEHLSALRSDTVV